MKVCVLVWMPQLSRHISLGREGPTNPIVAPHAHFFVANYYTPLPNLSGLQVRIKLHWARLYRGRESLTNQSVARHVYFL